jgi:hypothetical protein
MAPSKRTTDSGSMRRVMAGFDTGTSQMSEATLAGEKLLILPAQKLRKLEESADLDTETAEPLEIADLRRNGGN